MFTVDQIKQARYHLQDANYQGWITIEDDLYLMSYRFIEEDQVNWSDEQLCIDFDFSSFKYWIVDETKMEPLGVNTYKDLLPILRASNALRSNASFKR